MKLQSKLLLAVFPFLISYPTLSQIDTCLSITQKHEILSTHLNQNREFWVSLPMHYSDSSEYPVLYVLDAEWRFELIRHIAYDLAGNRKITGHIIVGIPHVDVEYHRTIDLTFSESRMEYDGDAVDSTWYNKSNSGGALSFYNYLKEEVIKTVDSVYATNGNNVLIGHSFGGYFGGYLLSMDHPFKTMQLYDPSIWYSDGEVTKLIKNAAPNEQQVNVYISYQPVPKFHKNKIEELIEVLKEKPNVNLHYRNFEHESHNSLYMYSFLEGILTAYETQ